MVKIDPTLARRIGLITFIVLCLLIYWVDYSFDPGTAASLSTVLWGILFIVGVFYAVFVSGDWKRKPFFSFDYLVPAIAQFGGFFALILALPDPWRLVMLIVGNMIMATLNIWAVPLLRKAILTQEGYDHQDRSGVKTSPLNRQENNR